MTESVRFTVSYLKNDEIQYELKVREVISPNLSTQDLRSFLSSLLGLERSGVHPILPDKLNIVGDKIFEIKNLLKQHTRVIPNSDFAGYKSRILHLLSRAQRVPQVPPVMLDTNDGDEEAAAAVPLRPHLTRTSNVKVKVLVLLDILDQDNADDALNLSLALRDPPGHVSEPGSNVSGSDDSDNSHPTHGRLSQRPNFTP